MPGEFVESLVGERHAARGEVGQHGRDGRLGQPAHRRDGVLGGGDIAAQGLQPRRQGAGGWAHQLIQAPVDEAAGALTRGWGGRGRCRQGRRTRRGRGAVSAQRIGQGAGGDRRAGRRPSRQRPVLAGRAPGLAGGAGDAARRGLTADRAGQERERRTAGTQRPVRGAAVDRAAAPQPMQVSRFAGSAMKQFAHSGLPWPSRVTGSRRAPQRAHCSKPRVRDARPADPHAVQRLVDPHDATAAGAGWTDDPSDAGGMQQVDRTAGSRATAPDSHPRSATRVVLPVPRPVSAGMRAGEPNGGRRRRQCPGWHAGPAR